MLFFHTFNGLLNSIRILSLIINFINETAYVNGVLEGFGAALVSGHCASVGVHDII